MTSADGKVHPCFEVRSMSKHPSVSCARLSAPRLLAFVLGTAAALWAVPAGADALRATVQFDAGDFRLDQAGQTARVRLGDTAVVGGHDQPELPIVEMQFYVPEGQVVRDVTVHSRDEVVVARSVRLSHAETAIDPAPAGRSFPSAAVSEMGNLHPMSRGVSLGGGNLGGFRIHSVAVFPVQWNRASGDVTLAQTLEVELRLEAEAPGSSLVRLRPNPAADAIFLKALDGTVVNPAQLPREEAFLRSPAGGSAGFAPEELPSVEGTGGDRVIICSAALEPHFQALADWKTKKGVPCVVRSIDWVETNYPAGRDQPERVRNFLRDAYRK
ncbi:MAG: C25 family cysteine peptidase, partial [Planctomycetota bacterium]